MPNFNLQKDTEKVKKFVFEKTQLPHITSEVVAILDASQSTQELYFGGTIQEAVQRVLPVALNFDDNGDVPVYCFNDEDNYSLVDTPLTKDNYQNYVANFILGNPRVPKWGGTDYAPVLEQSLEDLGFYKPLNPKTSTRGFFKKLLGNLIDQPEEEELVLDSKSTTGYPAILYFFTDGENNNDDRIQTTNLIKDCVSTNVQAYINFIGVGKANFSYLQRIANQFPNVGFVQIKDLQSVSTDSDKLYEYLLPDELLKWLGGVSAK